MTTIRELALYNGIIASYFLFPIKDEIDNVEFHLNEMKQMFSASNPDISSADDRPITGDTDPELNESHDLEHYSVQLDCSQMETTPEPTVVTPSSCLNNESSQRQQRPSLKSRKVCVFMYSPPCNLFPRLHMPNFLIWICYKNALAAIIKLSVYIIIH